MGIHTLLQVHHSPQRDIHMVGVQLPGHNQAAQTTEVGLSPPLSIDDSSKSLQMTNILNPSNF